MSIFEKFKLGLSKSSKNLSTGLNDLIFKKKIDENILNDIEDFLIQSDVFCYSLINPFTELLTDLEIDNGSSPILLIIILCSSVAILEHLIIDGTIRLH